jgi:hypothetical protein
MSNVLALTQERVASTSSPVQVRYRSAPWWSAEIMALGHETECEHEEFI